MIGIIGIVLIFTGFLISIVLLIASKNNHNVPSPKKNNGKYAILIPARNESKVGSLAFKIIDVDTLAGKDALVLEVQ